MRVFAFLLALASDSMLKVDTSSWCFSGASADEARAELKALLKQRNVRLSDIFQQLDDDGSFSGSSMSEDELKAMHLDSKLGADHRNLRSEIEAKEAALLEKKQVLSALAWDLSAMRKANDANILPASVAPREGGTTSWQEVDRPQEDVPES